MALRLNEYEKGKPNNEHISERHSQMQRIRQRHRGVARGMRDLSTKDCSKARGLQHDYATTNHHI